MKKLILILGLMSGLIATAEVMDRPGGIRIGQRMVLRPYVSLSYTYDSNVDSSSTRTKGSHSFSVNPGLNLTYVGDQFDLAASGWYQYHAYTSYSDSLNNHSYGETVSFNWHDGATAESDAWSFMLAETFSRISQDDDMMNDGGRGIGRNRNQFNINTALNRNFTEKLHASVYGGYYWLDYANDNKSYAPMFGWDRWTAGGEIGYRLSRWTDFFINGNYQGYHQDNGSYPYDDLSALFRKQYSGRSDSFTVHGGVGSAFTERISYRISGGWTSYQYADTGRSNGFTYDISGRWKMSDNWNMMLLASSYYQPSEREYGSARRNDTISWGIAHSMVRGKLTATLDLAYRHESSVYSDDSGNEYGCDILTGRIGLDYAICKFVSVYGRAEYQTEFDRGGYTDDVSCDYDRWRLTVGLRLQY